MFYAIAAVAGIFAGGVLSYLYASSVIAEYEKAANEVGVIFAKVAGQVTAVVSAVKK